MQTGERDAPGLHERRAELQRVFSQRHPDVPAAQSPRVYRVRYALTTLNRPERLGAPAPPGFRPTHLVQRPEGKAGSNLTRSAEQRHTNKQAGAPGRGRIRLIRNVDASRSAKNSSHGTLA
jgi:hypothetical protein